MRNRLIGSLVALCVILFLGALYASPYWVIKQARAAFASQDEAAVSAYIDYPRLQDNIKSQLNSRLQAEIDQEAKPNTTFAGFAALLANSMVDGLSKAIVSPQGLKALFQGNAIDVNNASLDEKSTNEPAEAAAEKKYDAHYLGFNQFGIEVPYKKGGNLVFELEREGLFHWKLVNIQFPEKL